MEHPVDPSQERPRRPRRARAPDASTTRTRRTQSVDSRPGGTSRRAEPADDTDAAAVDNTKDSNDTGTRRRPKPTDDDGRDECDPGVRRHRRESIPAGVAARRAAVEVAELTGHQPEAVISLERSDGEWKVGVEVVETHRIPDSADILAIYEVCLSSEGELISYRRTRRYARGQLLGEGR